MGLQDVADIISNQAGWKNKSPDENNTIVFELNDGLNLNIYSPEGKTIILHSTIVALPNDEYTTRPIIEKSAKYAVAACKKRKSIVSILDNKIILHQDITTQSENMEITKAAKDFLNDLAWWKNQFKS